MTPISTLSAETQKAVKEIAETIQPLLDDIHSKQPTTKDYYGDYMRILSYAAKQSEGKVKLLAIAMMYAGANPNGVSAAVKNII